MHEQDENCKNIHSQGNNSNKTEKKSTRKAPGAQLHSDIDQLVNPYLSTQGTHNTTFWNGFYLVKGNYSTNIE
jgi:hypothetical protein